MDTDNNVVWFRQRERSLIEFQELCQSAMAERARPEFITGSRLALKLLTDMGASDARTLFAFLGRAAGDCSVVCEKAELAKMFRIYSAVFHAAADVHEVEGGAR